MLAAMSTKAAVAIGFGLGVAVCVLFATGKRILFPSPIQALPFRAYGIHEKRYINGFLPDFSYELEATVKQESFERLVRRMRFPPESRQSDTLYVIEDQERQYGRKTFYRDGVLYYQEFKN
jgi:hypothetical protein